MNLKIYSLAIYYLCISLSDALDYKQEMRNFVIGISNYARSFNPSFIVIPQNGIQIITKDGQLTSPVESTLLKAIDGWGQEDLYYGAINDNQATPTSDTKYLLNYLKIAKNNFKKILITDYCWTKSFMDLSYINNFNNGFISFAADRRDLDNVPVYPARPYNENANTILKLADAKNFLYLINPQSFSSKASFINRVKSTNYDVIIMDAFFLSKTNLWTKAEIDSLKVKANGAKRLVISYMSIGEAETYRFYWSANWKVGNPDFIAAENPFWKGNYKVKYWQANWKSIIFGNDNSYTKKLVNSGFDGVYLDIIDAFEYFENNV